MADHGSIGTYQALFGTSQTGFGYNDGTPLSGVISGTVKENGVAEPYAWVALYYRRSGQLIARQQASATGTFSFTGLEPGLNEYYVVALNDGFNALVYDIVAAV